MSVVRYERGFTLVELMVATAVFSILLLAVTAATLSIGRSYQRSMYASNTQATASSIVDTLAQSVRFSKTASSVSGDAAAGTATQCVGDQQILYTYGRLVGDVSSPTGSRHGVVIRPVTPGCVLTPIHVANPALTGQKELLARGMRLSNLRVAFNPFTGAHQVLVRVVYGEDDLLCSESVVGSCNPGSATLTPAQLQQSRDLRCKPGRGSEFCAASELSTTVYKRL